MRQIKFRTWAPNCIDMQYRTLQEFLEQGFGLPLHDKETVVMQFTGLLDKNRKEIYEGDVLAWIRKTGRKKIVKWNQNLCCFNVRSFQEKYTNQIGWEVVGNIYENPELLK